MKKSDKIKKLNREIVKLEAQYKASPDPDLRDKIIRKRRGLQSLQGYSTANSNIFSVPYTVYSNETGRGLKGKK